MKRFFYLFSIHGLHNTLIKVLSTIAIALFIFCSQAYSQILDDSTKLIYGAHTTKYIVEADLLNNTGREYSIDTSINDFHNYDLLYKGKSVYQNLGNLGTPINNIYYQQPGTIGKNLGFDSYTKYAFNPDSIKYYDTRSPYSSVSYTQGTNGQQIGTAEFSRNIKPYWNFGFNVRRMTSRKIIGAVNLRDRLADHTSFLLYTRLFTKDSTYQVLVSYTILDHKNKETGGVKRDSLETNDDFFDNREEDVNLKESKSSEKRSVVHLYQQLSLTKKQTIQLFHTFDFHIQKNRFTSNLRVDSLFYPDKQIILPGKFEPYRTNDWIDYQLIENKIGVKGDVSDFYYRAYYRRKDFSYKQYYISDSLDKFNENIIGGNLSYRFNNFSSLNASTEYLFYSNYLAKENQDYSIKGEYLSRYIRGGYSRMSYAPTLLQLTYTGNNLQWNHMNGGNSVFGNILSDNLYVDGNIKWKSITVNPGINFSSISNYVYYDTLAEPSQYSHRIQILSLEMLVKLKWKWLNVENFVKYTNVSNAEIIKVPEIFNHTRLYYQNHLFKKAILVQFGTDLFWRSTYEANMYMPITQQYYLNNYFLVDNYLIADIFLNVQIKSVNAFLKLSNFTQGMFAPGYFATPYYPGMSRNFEFGIQWTFFD